jgi:IS1 family transposase
MRMGDLERSVALDATKRDIASRIRHVCEGFCQEEFEALVQRMAEIDVRYRMRDEWAAYRQPSSRPLTPSMS